MTVEVQKSNGKITGWLYTLGDGSKVYMASRTGRDKHREKQAWLIEAYTLRKMKEQGVLAVGVAYGKHLYLTKIDDFFGEKSFEVLKGWSLRGLPTKHFRVNPGNRIRTIERKSQITR